jgi:hypothetical protein
MAETRTVSLAKRMAAEALIDRAERLGRPIPERTLAKARAILREAAKQDAPQKPMGSPA